MAKILLVEDDKSLREIYGVRLMAEGYEIVSAGDGEEALAMAIKERPDLILSDVMMPKISGFDMLDILRSTTETKDVKVIMMTALSSEDQRARGEALGADRYLVKSQVGIEDVVRTVHDVLGDGVAGVTPAPVFTPAPAPEVPQAPEPVVASVAPEPISFEQSVAPAPAPIPAPVAEFTAPIQPPAPVYEAPIATPPVIEQPPVQVEAAPVFAPAPVVEPAPLQAPQVVIPTDPVPAAPTVLAPVTPNPVFTPAPAAEPSTMPQPTAPFSTPAPASVGERVIAPLTDPNAQPGGVTDISSQMEQALNNPSFPPTTNTPPTL